MKFLIHFFIIFSLFFNVSAQERPQWVSDRLEAFPEHLYISAVGIGSSVQEAKNDGISQLALYFNTRVQSEQRTNLYVQENESKKRTAQSDISVSSNVELPNLSFTSPYFNKSRSEYLICTYIDRSSAAEFYRQKLEQNLSLVQNILDRAKEKTSSLSTISSLSDGRQKLTESNEFLKNYMALSKNPKETYSVQILKFQKEIDSLFSAARKNATFLVQIKGDENETIKTILEEILESQNFIVSERSSYRISGSMNIVFSENDIALFARPSISLSIIDRKTGETVYTYKRQYPKWGHKTKDAAKSKAIAEVEKDLRENFHPAGK